MSPGNYLKLIKKRVSWLNTIKAKLRQTGDAKGNFAEDQTVHVDINGTIYFEFVLTQLTFEEYPL